MDVHAGNTADGGARSLPEGRGAEEREDRVAARERGDAMEKSVRGAVGAEGGAQRDEREAPRFRGSLDERGMLRVHFEDEELTLGAFLRRLRLVDDGRARIGGERR